MTSWLAPPWSPPESAPTAAVTPLWRSANVEQVTRAVNVEALSPWSACNTSAMSKVSASTWSGRVPLSMYRKFAAWPSSSVGSTGSLPALAREYAASAVGSFATSRQAFRRLAAVS